MADTQSQPQKARFHRAAWRVARAILLIYLAIVLSMMFLERWLVYPAPPRTAGDWNAAWLKHEDVWFQSADGTKLHGWFVPHDNPKRAILYCHGNGEHIAYNAELAAELRDALQASVFLFDYRGYGHSEGRPSEAGCIADGRAAQLWLAERMGIQPSDIVLMGRSLGGAVAVALASEQGAQALVIENSFSNMPDVAALHYPWLPVRWVMHNRYDSLTRIKQYRGPLIQCHGTDDSIVPIHMARLLFEAAPTGAKKWIEFPVWITTASGQPAITTIWPGFWTAFRPLRECRQQNRQAIAFARPAVRLPHWGYRMSSTELTARKFGEGLHKRARAG